MNGSSTGKKSSLASRAISFGGHSQNDTVAVEHVEEEEADRRETVDVEPRPADLSEEEEEVDSGEVSPTVASSGGKAALSPNASNGKRVSSTRKSSTGSSGRVITSKAASSIPASTNTAMATLAKMKQRAKSPAQTRTRSQGQKSQLPRSTTPTQTRRATTPDTLRRNPSTSSTGGRSRTPDQLRRAANTIPSRIYSAPRLVGGATHARHASPTDSRPRPASAKSTRSSKSLRNADRMYLQAVRQREMREEQVQQQWEEEVRQGTPAISQYSRELAYDRFPSLESPHGDDIGHSYDNYGRLLYEESVKIREIREEERRRIQQHYKIVKEQEETSHLTFKPNINAVSSALAKRIVVRNEGSSVFDRLYSRRSSNSLIGTNAASTSGQQSVASSSNGTAPSTPANTNPRRPTTSTATAATAATTTATSSGSNSNTTAPRSHSPRTIRRPPTTAISSTPSSRPTKIPSKRQASFQSANSKMSGFTVPSVQSTLSLDEDLTVSDTDLLGTPTDSDSQHKFPSPPPTSSSTPPLPPTATHTAAATTTATTGSTSSPASTTKPAATTTTTATSKSSTQSSSHSSAFTSPPLSSKSNNTAPEVRHAQVEGSCTENQKLTIVSQLKNCEPEGCLYEWFRVDPKFPNDVGRPVHTGSRQYQVEGVDVGNVIACTITPVSKQGVSGVPVTVRTSTAVVPADPQCIKLGMEGSSVHTGVLNPIYEYAGGVEGDSIWQWDRSDDGIHWETVALRNPAPPSQTSSPLATRKNLHAQALYLNLHDVGFTFRLTYTPVRCDGVQGAPATVLSEQIQVDPRIAKNVKSMVDKGTGTYAVKFGNEVRGLEIGPQQVKLKQARTTKAKAPYSKLLIEIGTDDASFTVTFASKKVFKLMAANPAERDLFVLTIQTFAAKALKK